MRSKALSIKAQGVGSCYCEQLRLVKDGLAGKYEVRVNSPRKSDITHYHTVNLPYFFDRLFTRHNTVGIGYVHFLPETIDNSLSLPRLWKWFFYRYLLTFYNSMDFLVVVNPVVKRKLSYLGVDMPKVVYIPNYVSKIDFHPYAPEINAQTRAELGYAPDDFIVMGAGQLQTRKGVADFVETARRLPDVKFIWVGGFSFGKMTEGYEEIKKLSQNLPANVNFTGIVEREKMAGIYNIADVFFLPSFNELFPMTILEAMACAKPVLLRDLDFYECILRDNYLTGSDVDGFASVIGTLRSDAQARELWSKKACKCHKTYSEDSVLKMWERLYDNAVCLKTGKPAALGKSGYLFSLKRIITRRRINTNQ
jgi:1,2-diacylglycerol-3-alpha-glucose alpha-1,2-galactosyltransferase